MTVLCCPFAVNFNWWVLSAAGTFDHAVKIYGGDTSNATINIPPDSAGKTIHVICEVTETGHTT